MESLSLLIALHELALQILDPILNFLVRRLFVLLGLLELELQGCHLVLQIINFRQFFIQFGLNFDALVI